MTSAFPSNLCSALLSGANPPEGIRFELMVGFTPGLCECPGRRGMLICD